MLVVRFEEDGRKRLSSFVAQGHTDFSAHGTDIVCAAVSGILQAAHLGLLEYARIPISGSTQGGNMRVTVAPEHRDNPAVAAILATARLSIAQIAQQFPDHLRFECEREA